jgi:hypothetical protein
MVVNSHPLYQLSYPGIYFASCCLTIPLLVVNPATAGLYQLSYPGMIGIGKEIRLGKYHIRPILSMDSFVPGLCFYLPSWFFLSSMITSFAIAFSVSKTPGPSTAQASKSGRLRGFSAFFISSSGTTFGRSRLLY